MQAKQAPPRLPGTSATIPLLLIAIVYGGMALLLGVPTIALGIADARHAGGHLPWPVAQWALTTPAGALGTFALCVLIAAPLLIVAVRRILRRWYLARAVDVTEVPPWVWLTRPPVYPGETRADRWLGRSRRARIATLALLVAAALIPLLLIAGDIGLVAFGLVHIRFAFTDCGPGACPPMYPVFPILLASEFVTLGLFCLAQYRLLRQAEASSGVWLRLRGWLYAQPLLYIRRPGVTPEAAATALAHFASAEAMPRARVLAISVLAAMPFFVLLLVAIFLQSWLPTQWVPG